MRLKTEKETKVVGNLLHVSSYRASNNIHTERWSIISRTTRKMLPFCFCPILITSCLCRKLKDTRLSVWYKFAFQESLGTRLGRSCLLCPPSTEGSGNPCTLLYSYFTFNHCPAGYQFLFCTNTISCCLCQCHHTNLDCLSLIHETQGQPLLRSSLITTTCRYRIALSPGPSGERPGNEARDRVEEGRKKWPLL